MKVKIPAKSNKKLKRGRKVNPPTPYLPRNPNLSRELLPLFGVSDFTTSIMHEFSEFRMANEYLPSLLFLTNSENQKYNILSPIESFSISGEPVGYIANLTSKLRHKDDKHDIKVFMKRVHLVEPTEVMEGLYELPKDGCLPKAGDGWRRTLSKIHNMYNEAYVDALCAASLSRLVETGKSPHWARFYGTFNTRVEKYVYNINDEIQSMCKNKWFNKNKAAGLFRIISNCDYGDQKPQIDIIGEEMEMMECETLSIDEKPRIELSDCESDLPSTDEEAPVEKVSERLVKLSRVVDSSSENSADMDYEVHKKIAKSDNFCVINKCDTDSRTSINSDTCSGSITGGDSSSGSGSITITSGDSSTTDSSTTDSSTTNSGNSTTNSGDTIGTYDTDIYSGSDQNEVYVEFADFPVQVTFHEYCTATMDSLLDIEETTTDDILMGSRDERWSAWIYQVIAGLVVAQYHYGFVHNDLHTNNVMWDETPDEFIYYKLVSDTDIYYRVPTYGKIMKIIDFGRATFWLKDRKKLIISDAYEDGNDAGGQYNCFPYYNDEEPEILPNPSFDLCRLAVSMFDAIYPEQPPFTNPKKEMVKERGRISYETESELYNLLWMWLTDCEGKNILRNPDDTERFPDFDLYKHIAKYSKNAIPREQATHPYFDKQFRISKEIIPENITVWDLPLA